MNKLKNRKWYSAYSNNPDRRYQLIIMTDMGYIFEAEYVNGIYLVSVVRDGRVYFEPYKNQECIAKFMKV